MKEEVKNGIIITIVVLIILAFVYFITAVFMTGELGSQKSNKSKVNTTSSSSKDEYGNKIIASNTFMQNENEYMVMFYNDDITDSIKNYLSNYTKTSDNLKLYTVNLNEAINSFVKSSETNTSATNYSELKINGNTLIVIKGGKIDSYITNEDEIVDKLK